MAKTINCHCGQKGIIDYSKGKHKTPFLRCPEHGAIMSRKKNWIDYLLANAKDEPDEPTGTDYKQESDFIDTKSDKTGDIEPKKSIFNGWGTVI